MCWLFSKTVNCSAATAPIYVMDDAGHHVMIEGEQVVNKTNIYMVAANK